jgi:hypothetical protein
MLAGPHDHQVKGANRAYVRGISLNFYDCIKDGRFRIYARKFPFPLLEIWHVPYYFVAVLLNLIFKEKVIDNKKSL